MITNRRLDDFGALLATVRSVSSSYNNAYSDHKSIDLQYFFQQILNGTLRFKDQIHDPD